MASDDEDIFFDIDIDCQSFNSVQVQPIDCEISHMAIMNNLEQDFLARHIAYNPDVEQIRKDHYPTLNGVTYLDFAAVTPYSNTLIDIIADDLKANLFGNPHSHSSSSQLTTRRIDDVRLKVLRMFEADPEVYDVVFVQNTTAAVKLVAEICVDAGLKRYICHQDAHTSLVGIRKLLTDSVKMNTTQVEDWLNGEEMFQGGLLAYPLQSNFSGRRMPLDWAKRARRHGYYTLADAAAYATTTALKLDNDGPDFLAVSFLKMFGYPDLAGLIVRKDNPLLVKRQFFGGGTVDFLLNGKRLEVVRKATPHDFLEDGTPPFHAIIALDKAIKHHLDLFGSIKQTSGHCLALATFVYEHFSSYKHQNGQFVAEIYTEGAPSLETQGATLTFNLKKADGTFIGFNEVSRMADVCNIHLRTGGLCNSGGVMHWMKLSEEEMLTNMESGKRCDDDQDILNGKPTGAVRISFGAMSTIRDAIHFLEFIQEHFVESAPVQPEPAQPSEVAYIDKITIFPIKSCGGFDVKTEWRLLPSGLEWDREWCLVHQGTFKALSQKQYPVMALIKPSIVNDKLIVTAKGKSLIIDLNRNTTSQSRTKICSGTVCTDKVALDTYEDAEISSWFTDVVGTPCTLARFPMAEIRQSKYDAPIHLSNESPLLVVNRQSYNALAKSMDGDKPAIDVFRANIIVSGANMQPYSEDRWSNLKIGNEQIDILDPCRRCQMINVNQETGEKTQEPYLALSKTRKRNGKIYFGVYAKHTPETWKHSSTFSVYPSPTPSPVKGSPFSSLRSRFKPSHNRDSSSGSDLFLLTSSVTTSYVSSETFIKVGDPIVVTERQMVPDSPNMTPTCLSIPKTSQCLPISKPSTQPIFITEKPISRPSTPTSQKRSSGRSFKRLSFQNRDSYMSEKTYTHKRNSSWLSSFTLPAITLIGGISR